MFSKTSHTTVTVAIGATMLWAALAGSASAAMSVNGKELNGRYLNGMRLGNGVSLNGIRLGNGASLNGIRLTNGVQVNGIRLRNGSRMSGRPVDRPGDGEATHALRPSSLCMIEPEFCGTPTPRVEPANVSVLFVTLPNGTSHVLK